MNSEQYEIRRALSQDVAGIVRLQNVLSEFHHRLDPFWKSGAETEALFRRHVEETLRDAHTLWLVVAHGDEIIGFFSAEIRPPKPAIAGEKSGSIVNAFVLEEHRGKGLFKSSVQQLFDWFKVNGVSTVRVSVDSRNSNGVRSWESVGFKEYMKKMKIQLF